MRRAHLGEEGVAVPEHQIEQWEGTDPIRWPETTTLFGEDGRRQESSV